MFPHEKALKKFGPMLAISLELRLRTARQGPDLFPLLVSELDKFSLFPFNTRTSKSFKIENG